jgi:hypothetical protein
MLLNVAAHNISIENVKVSKRERHIMYSVTKRTSSQNVKCSLQKHSVTVYVWGSCALCDIYVLKTLRFGTITLCAAMFCNITSCDVYFMLLYNCVCTGPQPFRNGELQFWAPMTCTLHCKINWPTILSILSQEGANTNFSKV